VGLKFSVTGIDIKILLIKGAAFILIFKENWKTFKTKM